MKKPSRVRSILLGILRYLALVVLVIAFGIVAPLWGLADNMVAGLTDQRTYERIIAKVGIGGLVADGMYKVENLLPASVVGYLQGSDEARGALDELNGVLAQSVDAAVTNIVSQVPAYVAGERDSLEGSVDLRGFKQHAVETAAKKIPGGVLVKGIVKRGVESQVPDYMPLDKPLMALEAILTPVRLAVKKLIWIVDTAGVAALNILVWIALISFALSRAIRWCSIALAVAGGAGLLLDGLLESLIGLALPDAVLDNHVFKGLLYDAVTRFGDTAEIMLYAGGAGFALSLLLPPLFRRLGRRMGRRPSGALLAAMRPRGGHATILTIPALLPALVSSAVSRASFPRRAIASSLGGYHVASRAFDFGLAALVMWNAGAGRGTGFFGTLTLATVAGLLILFWFLRDRPARLGGFNFVDRIADLRRGRSPGRRAPAASVVRSLPLAGAMTLSFFISPWIAFGTAAAVEVVSIGILWPDRSLFDLLAGTRARRISR